MMLFDFLFGCPYRKPALVSKVLGILFVTLGGGVGAYFLFEALSPRVGYLESGAIIAISLILLGCVLLYMNQQENTSPQNEATQNAIDFFKSNDAQTILKKNPMMLFLLSFGVGLILSRLKQLKSISEICKILKNFSLK